ncbi:Ppx/GppA family phosphatase [Leuconostoc carnosum]|uniref:Exopolyphosphatase n=2 Tax=Leuconostoc carnosum TaxID=1252 RepID=K0DB45_LEUCJ|nr:MULTISPECIES: Ppx/GppA family phosphatase [Leuconostoc]AFT81131.1 exopolyphosphatase [Leuconostoc carnosum JB16]KAA8326470.1 Ppx/GppA family phosphatase [Leuconostoc carnosum]KAA8330728.1 Ppx/GppA family phosphatase [Leuconostoc carnosum]KAA8362030.1 Ppx/GppA family phosphatase [Leuconostoc carnosum]KAA8366578.1 Ppx/GppA family phosphatase [Leuconostoc carnosum]
MTILAVIDLGSNSVRMTISQFHQDGHYEVLERYQEMVRLSKDMGDDKILQPEAIERTLNALKEFKKALGSYAKEKITVRAVATAAVRQATNQSEFLTAFEEIMAMPLEVLTGEQEAHYDYVGIINTLDIVDALILDTGGASAELILVRNRQAVHEVSLPVGAVTISESFLEKDVVSAAALFKATIALRQMLDNVSWLRQVAHIPVVALGGSNRTLAKISRRQNKVLDLPIHGYRLSKQDATQIYQNILSKNLEARKKIGGLAKERGDIIVGGLLPLIELLILLGGQQVIFSQAGLREGILFETIKQETGHDVVAPEPAAMTID